ncbi:MAG: glycosyltransferase family 4 protein [Eubacteriales bacterium]|jgi:glycosyltransferase involved in cell wall biosynthesis
MKKILFISNIANKVGSFSMAALNASKELGVEFHIAANWSSAVAGQLEKDTTEYGIHIHHLDLARSPYSRHNITAYKQLVNLIKKEEIDCVHCNTPVGGILGRLAAKKCGVKKVIYQAHGFHFYKGAPKKNWLLYYPIEKWLAHYTDALITINQEDYEIAKSRFKLRNNGKVYYVPGVGIDLKQYNFENVDDIRAKLRNEICLGEDATLCISMGDLIPRKNYSVAISAIGQLKEKYPQLHYAICGKGPELENLTKLAQECGVSDRVHFLGFRTDIKDLLKAADVFLFTSLQEGLPRSTMEAMASGLPIACSRIRGNTDLIDEGKGGVLFDPENAEECAVSLDKLLSSDMNAMSRYNLDKINEFSLDAASATMTEVYQNELSENSGGYSLT